MKAKTIIKRGFIYNSERINIKKQYEKEFNKKTLVNIDCAQCITEILNQLYRKQELNSIFI